jgi:Uncharacterized conserved protein
MSTKTISITEEAYNRLKGLKDSDRMSFSEVILRYYPSRRKLSEILAEIDASLDLAGEVEQVSEKLRTSEMRKADL